MPERITGDDLMGVGLKGKAVGVALRLIPKASKSLEREAILRELQAVASDPVGNAAHPHFAEVATLLREELNVPKFVERAEAAPYKVWGEGIEEQAANQMRQAVRLPVAV